MPAWRALGPMGPLQGRRAGGTGGTAMAAGFGGSAHGIEQVEEATEKGQIAGQHWLYRIVISCRGSGGRARSHSSRSRWLIERAKPVSRR